MCWRMSRYSWAMRAHSLTPDRSHMADPQVEALLKKLFGRQFDAYAGKVPRWIKLF